MYRIAVCDDKEKDIDVTEDMLKRYRMQHADCDFQIDRFGNADELLWMVNEENYRPDLLLLDIMMQGTSGIEAAGKLRQFGIMCRIVFLTVSREYALDAFRVEADQCLVKPVLEEDLFKVLDRWRLEMKADKKHLIFKTDGGARRVLLRDIVYCEAQKRKQCIYLIKGDMLQLGITMAKLYDMLSIHQGFVRVGVSYIINLEHVDTLNAQEILMDNQRMIYLPRGAYQTLKKQYFDYYCV